MKIKLLVIFLISQISFSQNHLEPIESSMDITENNNNRLNSVRELLIKDTPNFFVIRMVVCPSFSKEYLFEISQDYENQKDFYAILKEPIEYPLHLYYELKNKYKLNVKTYKSIINQEDAKLLKNLYLSAIKKTSYNKNNSSGLDGVTYYFSVWDDNLKSAKTWSPNDRYLKEFILICETIIKNFKESGKIEFSDEMKTSIIHLTNQFNKKLTHREIEFLLKFNQSILEIENQYPDLFKLNSSLSDELYEIYNDDVEEDVKSKGIYYGVIDDIIMEHKIYFDIDSDGEMEEKEIEFWENKIRNDNPFLKLIEIYKSDL